MRSEETPLLDVFKIPDSVQNDHGRLWVKIKTPLGESYVSFNRAEVIALRKLFASWERDDD